MEEKKQEPVKREWTSEQIMQKHIRTVSNHQMSHRLKRLSQSRGLKLRKNPLSNMDSAWAVILSTIFDNSKLTGGRTEAYLR